MATLIAGADIKIPLGLTRGKNSSHLPASRYFAVVKIALLIIDDALSTATQATHEVIKSIGSRVQCKDLVRQSAIRVAMGCACRCSQLIGNHQADLRSKNFKKKSLAC
jgi:hypothetical protein